MRRGQVLHAERLFRGMVIGTRIVAGHFAPDHHAHDFVVGNVGNVGAAYGLPVPQHGNAVGDARQLREPVGNIDNADPFGFESGNMFKQSVDFVVRKRRGWFVHHDDARLERDCLDDFNDLLLGNRQAKHLFGGVDFEPEAVDKALRILKHGFVVHEAAALGFAVEKDIFRNG